MFPSRPSKPLEPPPGFDRTDDDELLESGPSDEDETDRRRNQVKTLVLDPIPNASGFHARKLGIYTKVCAASSHDGTQIMRWIHRAETATLPELEIPGTT